MFCSILLYRNTLWLLKKPALSHLLPDCRNYDQISHHFEMRHCLDENMKILRLRLPFLCNAWNLLIGRFFEKLTEKPWQQWFWNLEARCWWGKRYFHFGFLRSSFIFRWARSKKLRKKPFGKWKILFLWKKEDSYVLVSTLVAILYLLYNTVQKNEKICELICMLVLYSSAQYCTGMRFCKCTLCNKYFSCLNISITLSTIKIFFYIYE